MQFTIRWDDVVLAGAVPTLHNQVIVSLYFRGDEGTTSAEMARTLCGADWALGLQSLTPRFKELVKKELIFKTTKKRRDPATLRTRSVWNLTDRGRDLARSLIRLEAVLQRSAIWSG